MRLFVIFVALMFTASSTALACGGSINESGKKHLSRCKKKKPARRCLLAHYKICFFAGRDHEKLSSDGENHFVLLMSSGHKISITYFPNSRNKNADLKKLKKSTQRHRFKILSTVRLRAIGNSNTIRKIYLAEESLETRYHAYDWGNRGKNKNKSSPHFKIEKYKKRVYIGVVSMRDGKQAKGTVAVVSIHSDDNARLEKFLDLLVGSLRYNGTRR